MDICQKHPGGAEVELSMLFVDVRGSTSIAEGMGAAEFSRLMNRFYAAVTKSLIRSDAFIDKLVGDEVIGLYLPIFAGKEHARKAVEAAQDVLRATGHGSAHGPWLAVGVGVHTGPAFFGTVSGAEGSVTDFTALGDSMNTAARLVAEAAAGEALISDAAYAAAGVDLGPLERRSLQVKGKTERVDAWALRIE